MISKIQIDDVACFKKLAELETDKKVNIIYGLNGTGKSTISNYLYDQTDLEYLQCTADVGSDEKLLVYNQRFVNDYFYEADSLKGVFSLSKENKDIEEKLKTAEKELATLRNEATSLSTKLETEIDGLRAAKLEAAKKTWKIKTQYTGGDRVLEFCLSGLMGSKDSLYAHISALPNPDSKPERQIPEIKKDVEAIHGDAAKSFPLLPTITFEEDEVEGDPIFKQIIVGNEDSPVSNLIKELDNSDWIRKGLDFMPTPSEGEAESCPFCQEKTITESLVESITSYFDKSFDDSIELISSLHEKYKNAANQVDSMEVFSSHPLSTGWLSELTQKHQSIEMLVTDNLSKIRTKKSSPSIPVTLDSTSTAFREFNEIVKKINTEVTRHNEKIKNVDNELNKLKNEFWSLMRWEYDQTISAWLKAASECKGSVTTIEIRRDSCTENVTSKELEISTLQKSTVNIEGAIENINFGLEQLGITDFSIVNHSDSKYRIVRAGDTEAKFSTLSEGEKMIISFLYFCEICKGKQSADETIQKKIVVIDDPISSLSHIFVFNIGRLIWSEFFMAEQFEQVFVLTHSLYFFYELADSSHRNREKYQKLFRLSKNEEGSTIRKMSYEEVQNDYHSYWSIVTDEDQHPALIANCMRNIIEYFFNFVQKADLNNVFLRPELQENRFQAFRRHINRESHSLGQNIFDYKEFNYDDFRDGLRLVFEVMGYPEHYKKMTTVFGP